MTKQVGAAIPEQSKVDDPWEDFRSQFSVLQPPFAFCDLLYVSETSNIIPQCVAVMDVNVDGQGYHFDRIVDPVIDGTTPQVDPPEVNTERRMLESTFENFNYDYSFTKLRRLMRVDLETYGNAYWEAIRNGAGKLVELNPVPAQSVRMTGREDKNSVVDQKVIIDGKVVTRKRWRRWRRFVQVTQSSTYVYFKEFGDRRRISAVTGKVLQPGEVVPEHELANELIHFKLSYPGNSPYGMPRWLGNMISSMGSRASEELNYMYFVNGRHQSFAVMVSGGMLTEESENKIRELLDESKGVKNAHKVLILEAEADDGFVGGSSSIKIDIKPLIDVLPNDALFQTYDKNNRDKVRSSFRIPKVLIGESEDYNRDTVEAAIKVANAQVFDPERRDFDEIIDRSILPELGAVHHKFKSKSFRPVGITDLSNVLFRLNKMGSVTPRSILPVVRDMLGIDIAFPEGAYWIDQPIALTEALIQQGKITQDGEPGPDATTDETKAITLVKSAGLMGNTDDADGLVSGLTSLRKLLQQAVEQGTE